MLIREEETFEVRSVFLSQVGVYIKQQFSPVRRWLNQVSVPNPASWIIPKEKLSQIDEGQVRQRPDQSNISLTQVEGRVPVTLLHLEGALNAKSYRAVIAKAQEAYQAGTRHILFDMSNVPSVGISSMVTLHSIAQLLNGEEPLDPEDGWGTLRTIAHDLKAKRVQERFKLLNPQPEVEQALERAGFKAFLEFHTDLETAVASF